MKQAWNQAVGGTESWGEMLKEGRRKGRMKLLHDQDKMRLISKKLLSSVLSCLAQTHKANYFSVFSSVFMKIYN